NFRKRMYGSAPSWKGTSEQVSRNPPSLRAESKLFLGCLSLQQDMMRVRLMPSTIRSRQSNRGGGARREASGRPGAGTRDLHRGTFPLQHGRRNGRKVGSLLRRRSAGNLVMRTRWQDSLL